VTKRGSLLGEMILFPKLPKGEFVSLKYWLMFVSKMKKERAKRSDGIHSRSDGIHSRSDVIQLRTPVLNPESSVHSLVRIPFADRPDAFKRAAPKIGECNEKKRWNPSPSGRPSSSSGRPALIKAFSTCC
jgi:hypothetical protein